MADERRFDDREVAQLLERAAQLAARDEAGTEAGAGVQVAVPAPRGL
ncbi:MAG: hypothetical protein HY275_05345, partial [Gemmatimonadetes bacterium]|nr:hypothetical protein [Gemmatimonadota bacterium]